MTNWDTDNPNFKTVGDGKYPLDDDFIDGINDGKHDNSNAVNIPVPPTETSKRDRIWMTTRRFGKGALWGGVGTFATTRDLALTGIGALIGGVGAAGEKLIKETNKSNGSTLTLANVWKEVSEAIIAIYKFLNQKKTREKRDS